MAGIESNHTINIAKLVANSAGRYTHHVRMELGSVQKVEALATLADTKLRYPEPLFRVELTWWSCSGYSVEPQPDDAAEAAQIATYLARIPPMRQVT